MGAFGITGAAAVGRWLKQQRHTHDLSQETLAEQIGYAPSTLQKIEKGVRRPSRTMAEQIVEVLAVPVTEQAQILRPARASAAPGDADDSAMRIEVVHLGEGNDTASAAAIHRPALARIALKRWVVILYSSSLI